VPDSRLAGRRVALLLASSTGGVGTHVRSLALGLLERGVHVRVLAPAATEDVFGFRATGAAFAPVEIAAGIRPYDDARAGLALRRLLRADPVDLVHAHGLRAGAVSALVAPRPRVVTWHNAVLARGVAAATLTPLELLVARRADLTLGASADLVARAARLGARDVRLAPVAAPALAPPARPAAQVRAELGAQDRPLVLAIGRLHSQKAFDVLVDAAAITASRNPPPLVVVAGDGPENVALQQQIARTGVPVRLLGRRSDVPDLLAAADVVVLPSRWEARALVAQEALLAGRPLVATPVGGIPDLVGDGACLVPPDNPAALAAALRALLDDPAQAGALVERGRRRAATWPTPQDTIEQVAEVYAELLSRTA